MANITDKPIQNIWASQTTNIEASSEADAQGIQYGAEIVSNQLNGALNTLSNQVAFNQYNGGQYNSTLSYHVGNVVSLYYRASESVSYVKTFFKCINDNGGNGITNVSPISGANASVESGIMFVTGGSFNNTNWAVLEKKEQPNVIYHSNDSYNLNSLKTVGNTHLQNGGGIKAVGLGWGYLFSLPKTIPSSMATQGQPMVVTEKVRIKWVNTLTRAFNQNTFPNFSSNPNFSFNQANDQHDYIITLEAKYNESGSLVNYDLEFSDFNCQIAPNTIPTFLTMGVRSASALFEVDGGSSVPCKLFCFINPLTADGSICGSVVITFLNSNTILQNNQSHASAVGNVDINTIDTAKLYKIGRGLGTKTLKKIGEFKYSNQPTIYQEDGWYDLAILTEVEKYLCNGGVYNTNASSYFTGGPNNAPYLQPMNTDGSTIPFNPVNNASGIYKWLLLPSYMQNSILQDGSNIYQCFMSMAQEGLTSIGLLSMNNALNPTNVSQSNQSFTEQFAQQFQQDNKPAVGPTPTIGTTTKYGTLNYIKMALNNYCAENMGSNTGVAAMSYPPDGNGSTPQNIPSPVYLWYTQQHIYNYDRQGRTNSSFSAPASIYCSLSIRVG